MKYFDSVDHPSFDDVIVSTGLAGTANSIGVSTSQNAFSLAPCPESGEKFFR
jgi:hypothetical protein